uniref:Uncharacterized protein n=1 Tax=Arundo donax TaxID=35708 RepID=A0A0A9ESR9_ARUDO
MIKVHFSQEFLKLHYFKEFLEATLPPTVS